MDPSDSEFRLFLEEICCELCRFRHVEEDKLPPEAVQLAREVYLGVPGAFADIHVSPAGQPSYFVEVKYGYSSERIVRHLKRKYGKETPATQHASRVVLIIDRESMKDWGRHEHAARASLRPGMQLDVWDEAYLLGLIKARFGLDLRGFGTSELTTLRSVIDNAKWQHAFGDTYVHHPMRDALLWHLGFWRLRQLREQRHLEPELVLPPGHYPEVGIILCDLCSFSSFVRDTRDPAVVRHCLMTFYSCARYAILNAGGMLYQFVGDEVIGLFGIPERNPGYVQNALNCAKALADIGNSVSHHWQRQIDRVQTSSGVHIGLSLGDLQILSLRPFTRSTIGATGDSINMAARLRGAAGSSDIVVSNSFFHKLEEQEQAKFQELTPLDGRNVGSIKCWKQNVGYIPAPTTEAV